MTKRKAVTAIRGCDDFAAALGLNAAAERLTKGRLAAAIEDIIRKRGLSQAAAAKLMGIDQRKVPSMLNGRLTGFSMHRLLECLTALGQDVSIVVRAVPNPAKRGGLWVISLFDGDHRRH